MTYLINTETLQFIENKNLGKSFRQAPWREATASEITKHNLETLREEKYKELKSKRDEYKIANNYMNENIVMNLLNNLGNYTEEERQACRDFFNDLILKYDNFKEQINNAKNEEELNNINITFEG